MIHIDNSGLSKNTLIVGADDSNHCGDSKGEIIMVTFSWYNPDCVVKDYPNRRDYGAAYKWLEQGEEFRDYFFIILFRGLGNGRKSSQIRDTIRNKIFFFYILAPIPKRI